jgi:hypothetical protein
VRQGGTTAYPYEAYFPIAGFFGDSIVGLCIKAGWQDFDIRIKSSRVFGQINVTGDDKVGHDDGSSERSLPFVVRSFGVFVVEHYSVIEVINYFICVFPQIISIERIKRFFVKKNSIEIFCLRKQSATRHYPLRQLLDAAINVVCFQSIEVNGYSLPETGSVSIIG